MKHENIYKLTLTALMAALSYVIFTFLQIQITLPGGDATSFHLGNAVCVLGALLVGGVYGGIGGAIGMTIGDLFNPVYVVYAPKTFILKFCIGLITGLIAHKIGHISTSNDNKHVLKWTIIATVCGLGFNVVFDPLFEYYNDFCQCHHFCRCCSNYLHGTSSGTQESKSVSYIKIKDNEKERAGTVRCSALFGNQ